MTDNPHTEIHIWDISHIKQECYPLCSWGKILLW